ncbi:MAG TPA: hypothetical protein VK891_06780 [Euzebyales bacterium]|nr:hypothetical protein [Euzebyales bacterium]
MTLANVAAASTTAATAASSSQLRVTRRSTSVVGSQPEPDPPHRLDPCGVAELAAQRADVHIDGAAVGVPARLPHLFGETAAADHDTGLLDEHGEQVELLGRQLDLAAVEPYAPGAGIQLERTGSPRPVIAARRHPAGHQLAEPERLDDVVIGAQLEPQHPVGLVTTRGDDDDRHLRPRAQLPAHVIAVDVGQPQIEQHDVDAVGVQRRGARRHHHNVIAPPAQSIGQRLGDRRVVFDHEHVHRHASLAHHARGRPASSHNPYTPLQRP